MVQALACFFVRSFFCLLVYFSIGKRPCIDRTKITTDVKVSLTRSMIRGMVNKLIRKIHDSNRTIPTSTRKKQTDVIHGERASSAVLHGYQLEIYFSCLGYKLQLPDFIRWGPEYESVYYGINNTRPIYSERAHRALQNP